MSRPVTCRQVFPSDSAAGPRPRSPRTAVGQGDPGHSTVAEVLPGLWGTRGVLGCIRLFLLALARAGPAVPCCWAQILPHQHRAALGLVSWSLTACSVLGLWRKLVPNAQCSAAGAAVFRWLCLHLAAARGLCINPIVSLLCGEQQGPRWHRCKGHCFSRLTLLPNPVESS